MPDDSAYTLRAKNIVEISQSHTVSKMNAFLHVLQKIKIAAKNSGKTILGKKWLMNLYALRIKNFIKTALAHFLDTGVFFTFYTEFQDGRQKWPENDFWKKVADDSAYTQGVNKF